MVGVAVGEADDLESLGFRIFLDAQLLEWIQLIPVPRPVLDRVPHPTELNHLVIAPLFPTQQCAARLVRIARLEVFPHPIHHRPGDSKRQNLRR